MWEVTVTEVQLSFYIMAYGNNLWNIANLSDVWCGL